MVVDAPLALFLMVGWHAIADLPLQPGPLSQAKRPGGDPSFPWPAATAFHSLIHGFGVALITGLWWLGVAETLAHAVIDQAKCRGVYGMKIDQALHLLCKAVWTAAFLVAV